MKIAYRRFVAALFLSLMVLPFMASYSFAADYDSSSSNEELTKEVVGPAEDFSLDGLSAEASDGGAPLLGDECKLGLSVSGNSGSLAYKFVWEQGGWARWARSARATRPPRAPGSPRSPATLISGLTPSTRTVGLPPASSRCTWRIIWKISTRYPLSLLMA